MSEIELTAAGGGVSKAEVEAITNPLEEEIDNIESGTTLVSLIEKALATPEEKTITSTQNNWAVGPVAYIELNSTALRAINGIVAPSENRPGLMIVRLKGTTSVIEVHHENGSATEANRFFLSLQTTERIRLGYAAIFAYDHKISRWVDVVAINSARAVAFTIAAGNTEATLVHNLSTANLSVAFIKGAQYGVTRTEAGINSLTALSVNELKVTFTAETTEEVRVMVTG